MTQTRVLALVPSQPGYSPGQRGSIELWEKVLTPAGIELDFAPFESEALREILYQPGNSTKKIAEMSRGYLNRLRLLSSLDDYDAVFIYREAALIGPALIERLIARKKPIIYQLDDPLFVPYKSPANGMLSYLKFFGKVKEIIRMSSSVLVNSTKIREYAEQYNRNIWQVPSVVDTETFRFDPADQDRRPVTAGWSGSPTTLRNVKMIEAPLQKLGANGRCALHFIGADDFNFTNVQYTASRWKAETEIDDLRKIQIGFVPLPSDNPWNPYKFIMKTAQYMALGIVPVGTPMASNTEVIRHGENGFLAASDNDWFDYVSLLASDHDLRKRMSVEAAQDAKVKYSLQANAEKIISAFKSAVSSS